jgi:hypothetical protein
MLKKCIVLLTIFSNVICNDPDKIPTIQINGQPLKNIIIIISMIN